MATSRQYNFEHRDSDDWEASEQELLDREVWIAEEKQRLNKAYIIPQLKDMLRELKLKLGGNKPDLIARLVEHKLKEEPDVWRPQRPSRWRDEAEEEKAGFSDDDVFSGELDHDLAGHLVRLKINSTSNVKRRALVVGCGYIGTESKLRGTLEDASRIEALLKKHNFGEYFDSSMSSWRLIRFDPR